MEIFRRSDEVALREKRHNLAEAFDRLRELPDDMIEAMVEMDDPPPEDGAF